MKRQKFFNLLFLLPFLAWHLPAFINATDDYSDLVISNLGEARSRLLMVDGNMYFHAGKSKNITFRVSDGASILFGKTDILSLPNSTQISDLQNLIKKHIQNVDAWNTMFSTLQTQIYDSKTEATHMVNEIKLIKQNITSLIKARKGSGRTNSRLRKLLTMVNENIVKVVKMIQTNECQQNPCQNGGTCIDLVSKYQCLCPSHFGGKNCDERIDECELYGKTHLGCQNNATCSNNGILPGFICHCQKGFHGRRCQTKSTSCDYSLDLCGEHGHCMPGSSSDSYKCLCEFGYQSDEDPSSSSDSYKCLCEFGYQSDEDPSNPTCIDVNECAEKPCHPGAECINLPGGFKCSSCPIGLQGNGINCYDIDECREEMSNDCSKNPKVQCLNTWGSYHCGPCPGKYRCEQITKTDTEN
uniref:EGF-like domain-containing protein n=1 Tax=Panagrolaimus sp. PS1159 TaxID=55785 RepID=A0AC35FA40_9BILA